MNERDKALLAVAVGYVLGRTKKGKLALMGAAVVTGRNFGPRQLLIDGVRRLGEVPAVGALGEQVRGEVYQAVRRAAGAAVARQLDSRIAGRPPDPAGDAGGGTESEEPQEEGDGTADRPADDADDADTGDGAGTGKSGRSGAEPSGTAPKRTAARKRPAAKKAAGRSAAKKADAPGKTAGQDRQTRRSHARSARTTSGR